MKIGFAVDGQAEVASLPCVREQLSELTTHTLLFPPVLVSRNAMASPAGIATECAAKAQILLGKGIQLLVLLIDREANPECCGAICLAIERELGERMAIDVAVVIKNQTFENWLLADLRALDAAPGRFHVSNALRRRIEPNKADHVDAMSEMKKTIAKGTYNKVSDAQKILRGADPMVMSQHSRSFRRLLRVLGVPAYASQSRTPG